MEMLYNEKLHVNIPENFIRIKNIGKEYQMKYTPQYIYKESTSNSIITFVEIESEIVDFDVEKHLQAMELLYSRLVPGFKNHGLIKKDINGNLFGAIKYQSFAVDRDLFNTTFVTCVNNKEYIINTYCTLIEFSKWSPVFIDMIESIRFLEK